MALLLRHSSTTRSGAACFSSAAATSAAPNAVSGGVANAPISPAVSIKDAAATATADVSTTKDAATCSSFFSTVSLPGGKLIPLPKAPPTGSSTSKGYRRKIEAERTFEAKLQSAKKYALGEDGCAAEIESEKSVDAASTAAPSATEAAEAAADEDEARRLYMETARRMLTVKKTFKTLDDAANAGNWTQISACLAELEMSEDVNARIQMYNIALKGIPKVFSGDGEKILAEAEQMKARALSNGEVLNGYTYAALVNCALEAQRFDLAEDYFKDWKNATSDGQDAKNMASQVADDTVEPKNSEAAEKPRRADEEVLYSTLINGAFKLGKAEKAEQYFNEFKDEALKKDTSPTVVMYSIMVYGFARRCSDHDRAIEYFKEMEANGVKANAACYMGFMSYWASQSNPKKTAEWMQKMLDNDVRPDAFAYNCVLGVHINASKVEDALHWLGKALSEDDKQVKRRDLRIDGLLRLVIADGMRKGAPEASASALQQGEEEGEDKEMVPLERRSPIEQAEAVFSANLQGRDRDDIIAWNLMISFLFSQGEGVKAQEYFDKLKNRQNSKSRTGRTRLHINSYTHYAMMRGLQGESKQQEAIAYFDENVKQKDQATEKLSNLMMRLLLEAGEKDRASEHRKWHEVTQGWSLDSLSRQALADTDVSALYAAQEQGSDVYYKTGEVATAASKAGQFTTNTVVNSKSKVVNRAASQEGGSRTIVDWEAIVENAGEENEKVAFLNIRTGETLEEQPAFGWIRVKDPRYGESPYFWDVTTGATQWTAP
ncbi:unnamed protein product [Amoebophrya sp. A25]|nr:unnamed protein product [Amoebophrya sp. A25]|eukprot:GSA25T00001514001.1